MILNIFKPKGWTSFDVVAKLKGILGTKKIGHAGTLDPLAEGVLLVLTEGDTKKQDVLMHQQKEYVAEFAFGAESETYDLEGALTFGKVLSLEDLKVSLEKFLPKYLGKITQTVPAYSAVKVAGKKLYKLARKGQMDAVELPKKEVEVFSLEILEYFEKEFSGKKLPCIKIKINCSSGFYVRSLAHDLGFDLGVGGVMTSLLRTRVGDFLVGDSREIIDIQSHIQ